MRIFLVLFLSLFFITQGALGKDDEFPTLKSFKEAYAGYNKYAEATDDEGARLRTFYAEKAYEFGFKRFGPQSINTANLAVNWIYAYEAYQMPISPIKAVMEIIKIYEKKNKDNKRLINETYSAIGNILGKTNEKLLDNTLTNHGRDIIMASLVTQNKLSEAATLCQLSDQNTFEQGYPEPIRKYQPKYPTKNKNQLYSGFVVVEFNVTTTGTVDKPRVLCSYPRGFHDKNILKAVSRNKYKPLIVEGSSVYVNGLRNTYNFKVNRSRTSAGISYEINLTEPEPDVLTYKKEESELTKNLRKKIEQKKKKDFAVPTPPQQPALGPKTYEEAISHCRNQYIKKSNSNDPFLDKMAPLDSTKQAEVKHEGFVYLEFEVTKLGTVKNPKVLCSYPEGNFDKGSIRAALKFKYKPKTVNGIAVNVLGVRNLITFESNK